ncbi:MAG: Nif3-like dinuclear metal center hexameric protein [Peptococcaceae bacterium]|nr:Nif3-like dinuclear metal center hexameric protein [Peptococcaceae bacterium]
MSIRCQSFLELLEQWAPPHFAEDWDNVGLHAGDRNKEISRIMVALSPGEDAVNAAIEAGVDMLVTHHPLIFRSMKQINSDTATGRSLLKLIRNDVNLYCTHTNMDIAKGGVNDVLADYLELEHVRPLADITKDICYKVVVYVPVGYEEIVRQAMCNAGAGCIGNYSGCTFQAKGTGTFLPGEGTSPFIGEAGRMEYAEEYRVETVLTLSALSAVIKAMEAAHPYEEAAYDVFRMENAGEERGIGRIGQLKESMSLAEFLDFTASKLGCDHMTYQGDLTRQIKTVALCGGSGLSYTGAAKKAGADVYVTGDMRYHDAQAANEMDMCVVDAGHLRTERMIVDVLADFARKQGLEVMVFDELKQDYLKHWTK